MNSLLIAVQTGTKFAYIEFAEENYLTILNEQYW